MIKKILFWACAGIFLAACSDDDDDNNNNSNERIPIDLSTRLSVEFPRLSRQDTQIAKDQQVSFFVTRTGNIDDQAYNNALLTADGLGNFSYLNNGETTLYYPIYTDDVDFYAIHPYSANITLGEPHNFSVFQDQSTIRNFLDSDLLYVKRTNIARQRDTVQLRFNHKLSKINFIIRAGAGTSLIGLNNIEILNIKTQTVLNTADGSLAAGSETLSTIRTYGLADNTANVSETEITGVSAIIVPQTFPAGEQLFRISINGVPFIYTSPAAIVYNSGKSYNYTIRLTNTGIIVNSSVEDWLPGEDTEGEGIIE